MSRFNLSRWALDNTRLVGFFLTLIGVMGVWSYFQLGRSEDPPFVFRVMVVQTYWPGATADEMDRLVTDRIEEKLQELDALDYLKSYSRPGESQVFIVFRDDKPARIMPDNHYQARKKIEDIRASLPLGVQGPFFDDEFGDTFGNILALQGEDYSHQELEEYADRIRDRLLRVRDVAKVRFLGRQEQRIYVDLANSRRDRLGLPLSAIFEALAAQNEIAVAGDFDTATDKIYLRVSGALRSVEQVRELPLVLEGRSFRLGDIAEVSRGYQNPPAPQMEFDGKPALGIAVSMERGGDIVRLGRELDAEFERLAQDLPLGMTLSRAADQRSAVQRGVNEFIRVLIEAVVIVLAVCFVALGLRTGLVVAMCIPLVLAMTFAVMDLLDIDLHKISLGSLVIALGLLVDDAIIAVEMMAVKLEEGYGRVAAAAFTYTSTAFPMLSGTLVTAAGFLPIATANSGIGEYTRSMFQVVTIALILSWLVAVILVPLLGYRLLPERGLSKDGQAHDEHSVYHTPFYNRFRRVVEFCVNRRHTVITATLAIFAVCLALLVLVVPQQFFPVSDRLELMVDLKLPEGASIQATEEAVARFDRLIAGQDGIESYASYIGSGAPRFFLSLDLQLPAPSFAQIVINARDLVSRDRLRSYLFETLPQTFPDLRWRISRLEMGPPVGYPLQYRVSGPDASVARREAEKVADVLRASPHAQSTHLDTAEKSKVVTIAIDQDRARALGVSSAAVSRFMATALDGTTLSYLREDNDLIAIQLRGRDAERARIDLFGSLSIQTESGTNVPLSQIARIGYGLEDGILWRRDRVPTVSVRADIASGLEPPQVVEILKPQIDRIGGELPRGYRLELAGSVEESDHSLSSVKAGLPLFALVVVTTLMIQLRRFSLVMMVVLTGPLGLIGVPLALLAFGKPFGFIAILGVIAMFGMIMRNTVILVDQIDQDLRAGHSPYDAVVEATVRRLRPIVLTAAAAVLAMIPLSRSVFFGPQAVATMGGLIAATVLTLLFVPALYAAWYRVPRKSPISPPVQGLPASLESDG